MSQERIVVTLISGVLGVAVWIVFGQTLHHGFVDYDDNIYVYDNPQITGGLSFNAIGWAFSHIHADNWHPLTTISHMLDCQLFGVHPWGHHLTNVLSHALAAVLLFLAVRKLTLETWSSAFVSALFAIHPLRVESVAWISERKDVLSGVFFALTLWAYASYVRENRHRSRNYVLVIVCFILGLLCKPTLVTLPFVLLLLDYWPLGRWQEAGSKAPGGESETRTGKSKGPSPRVVSTSQPLNTSTSVGGLIIEKIPLFVLSAASCLVTMIAQKGALDTMRRLAFQERFANAVLSYGTYLGQMIYPVRLTPLNPFTQNGPGPTAVVVCLAGLWVVTIACFIWRKRLPFLITGWLWYVGMLVPMSGIVQVGRQTHADRYTYLPAIGLYILATWTVISLLNRSTWRNRFLAATAPVILIVFGTISYLQTSYWKDSETLWTHALLLNPNNYVAHNNLGNSIMARGDVDEAIRHFRAATAADPTYAEAHYNLGNALAARNQFLEAIPSFQAAIRARPKFYQAYNNMACMLMNVGKTDQAIAQFNEAIRIRADYQEAHLNLGQLLTRVGRTEDAKAHLAEAARLKTVQGEKKNVSNFAVSPQ